MSSLKPCSPLQPYPLAQEGHHPLSQPVSLLQSLRWSRCLWTACLFHASPKAAGDFKFYFGFSLTDWVVNTSLSLLAVKPWCAVAGRWWSWEQTNCDISVSQLEQNWRRFLLQSAIIQPQDNTLKCIKKRLYNESGTSAFICNNFIQCENQLRLLR